MRRVIRAINKKENIWFFFAPALGLVIVLSISQEMGAPDSVILWLVGSLAILFLVWLFLDYKGPSDESKV